MKLLITGGCGFIGSNYIRRLLQEDSGDTIVNLDALTYAGNLANLADVENSSRYAFVKGDITDNELVERLVSEHEFDAIINFAAESHVDRSILNPQAFLTTNVLGTQVLLQAARKHNVGRFLQVSTDEVYGSLGPEGEFRETTPLAPRSPYSASKASADHLVMAYVHTYGMDAVITRCSNNYGPYQFPEKLIPLMIINALNHKELPVYGDGLYVRDWIHVLDHCRAIDMVLRQGTAGEVYNIGSDNEIANLDLVRMILALLKRPKSLIRHVEDRPGHDRRYAIDATKVHNELGWHPLVKFADGLRDTVNWYLNNETWVNNVTSGDYRLYYDQMYGKRKDAPAPDGGDKDIKNPS